MSVCIITKNESAKLKRCIKQLMTYPFEIVVVDTGSDDDTVDMLWELQKECEKIKMHHFEWCDDFAAAKNFAVSQAECDMVMVLDSDEYLGEINILGLRRDLTTQKEKVGRIYRRNQIEQSGQTMWNVEWVNRIFSKSTYHYEGRIHEQLVRFDGKGYKTYETPIRVEHDGYAGTQEERRKKLIGISGFWRKN